MKDDSMLIIHGDDQGLSRLKLNEEIKRIEDAEIERLNGAVLDLSSVVTACESGSLFSQNKILVFENFFKGKISGEKEKIAGYLNKVKSDHRVIFWEDRGIEKKLILKFFPDVREINCNYPQVLFRFLDSLGEKSGTELINIFHVLLKEKEAELIFVMLVRQLRLLIMAKDQVIGSAGIKGWQAKKFTLQSRYFTLDKLISLYRQLLSIDIRIKSGTTPYSYRDMLDIFLLSI